MFLDVPWEDPVTVSAPTSGSTDPVGRLDDVRALTDLLPRFLRLAAAHKQHLSSEGRDRAAHVLLFPIDRLGPLRQSALAELMHSDPSTVSRQAAQLVKAGFAGRRKKLRSSLAAGLRLPKPQADELLQRAGIDGDRRAQELSLKDWHKLYLQYANNS